MNTYRFVFIIDIVKFVFHSFENQVDIQETSCQNRLYSIISIYLYYDGKYKSRLPFCALLTQKQQ